MNWKYILITAIIIALIRILISFVNFIFNKYVKRKYPPMIIGEIGSSKRLQIKYGLYAENAPKIRISKNQIPADLHDLISLAKKYGVGDDIIRSDIENKASSEEKELLRIAVAGREERIRLWLESLPDKDRDNDYYYAFFWLLEAYEEWAVNDT